MHQRGNSAVRLYTIYIHTSLLPVRFKSKRTVQVALRNRGGPIVLELPRFTEGILRGGLDAIRTSGTLIGLLLPNYNSTLYVE
jgi:hypothetical protein